MIIIPKTNPTPETIARRPILSIATLILASSKATGFNPANSVCRRYERSIGSAGKTSLLPRSRPNSCGRYPLNLYVDHSESAALPRTSQETAEKKKGQLAAEESSPCADSNPLCTGTTPTPVQETAEQQKAQPVAEGSSPCATSDPLCTGTTPTPVQETAEQQKAQPVAEGSIPCATSDPLCKGTTPTPVSSKGSVPVAARRRRRSRSSVGKQRKSHLHALRSPEHYESEVLNAVGDDTIVVVRFHAPYCNACKMIKIAYDRFAKMTVDSSNAANMYKVKFVDVEILDRNDFPDLKVPATPYGMIYHPPAAAAPGGGLLSRAQVVERTPIARRQFSKFKKTLNWYRKGLCEMPEEFFTNPHYMFEDENLIL